MFLWGLGLNFHRISLQNLESKSADPLLLMHQEVIRFEQSRFILWQVHRAEEEPPALPSDSPI